MDKLKQPGINFESVFLVKESFWRDYVVPKDSKLNISFKMSVSGEGTKRSTMLSTTLTLQNPDKKDVLVLECDFVGIFAVKVGEENMDLDTFVKDNSPALMIPFIREHIYSVSQKSGIKGIMLPPVNVRALIKED